MLAFLEIVENAGATYCSGLEIGEAVYIWNTFLGHCSAQNHEYAANRLVSELSFQTEFSNCKTSEKDGYDQLDFPIPEHDVRLPIR